MFKLIAKGLLGKGVGEVFNGLVGSTPANKPEVYIDRIKRDFKLNEYNDALVRYYSDPAYWQKFYGDDPLDSLPQAPGDIDSFDTRFGKWGSRPEDNAPPAAADSSSSFDDRFGDWSSAPAGSFGYTSSPFFRALQDRRQLQALDEATPQEDLSQASPAPDIANQNFRTLSRRVVPPPPASALYPSPPLAPDQPPSFSDRFGNWSSLPGDNAASVPAPPVQAAQPLGLVSGQPMSGYRLPASLWGLSDPSDADDNDNWYTRWLRSSDRN